MEIVSTFLCLLAAIPGPPGFTLSGAWFQLTPVHKDIATCDEIDPFKDVTFQLYQGFDATTYHSLVPGDLPLLKLSGFDSKLPTVVYVHGFLNGPDAEEVQVVKQAYLTRGGHNFIAVGWRRLAAGPWYSTAVANVGPVGRYVASLLDFLEEKAGPLNSVHLVGHSLGAHVCGVAASNTSIARVRRVTGLDPALPFIDFTNSKVESRLDASDAPFVDAIHTDSGTFGVSLPVGHADFYPNGGEKYQPGCGLTDTPASLSLLGRVFCSHRRSYWLYAASVVRELAFAATSCTSWQTYQDKGCYDKQQVPMGFATPESARGSYYVTVKSVPPF